MMNIATRLPLIAVFLFVLFVFSGCSQQIGWNRHSILEVSDTEARLSLSALRLRLCAAPAPHVERPKEIGEFVCMCELGLSAERCRDYVLSEQRLYQIEDGRIVFRVFEYKNVGVSRSGRENIVVFVADAHGHTITVDRQAADRLSEPLELWSWGTDEFLVAVYSGPWYSQSAPGVVVIYRLDWQRATAMKVASILMPERHATRQPKITVWSEQSCLRIRVQDIGGADPADMLDRLDVVEYSIPWCSIERQTDTEVQIAVRAPREYPETMVLKFSDQLRAFETPGIQETENNIEIIRNGDWTPTTSVKMTPVPDDVVEVVADVAEIRRNQAESISIVSEESTALFRIRDQSSVPNHPDMRYIRLFFNNTTPTALWAYRQVDTLLSGDPETLRLLSEQARAIAVIEGDDPDAALPMDLRSDEMDTIWGRVREHYDTEWVRGSMVHNGRAQFVHTLMALYIQKKAPALFGEIPGAFDDEARRWPAWIESHKASLGLE